jgi:hypothetical protein
MCLSLGAITACGGNGGSSGNNGNGPECTTNDQCTDDLICEDGVCVEDAPECVDDEGCSAGNICTDAGECEAGCRDADDCSGTLTCLDDSTCGCNADDQCAGDLVCLGTECGCETDEQCGEGNVCVSGACEAGPPKQCAGITAGGVEDCDNTEETADGFICINAGNGSKCYFGCNAPGEEAVCLADGGSGCQSGSFCVNQDNVPNFCYPSECQDPEDLAGCDAVELSAPADYPNGASCVPAQSGTFVCRPAGPNAEGDACGEQAGGCGEGLICGLDSVCTPYCDNDNDCSNGDRCLGEQGRFFEGFNWGICGPGCDAFSTGQCGEGEACQALTAEDGLCVEEGPSPVYGACDGYTYCNSSSDCPNGEDCSSSGICEIDAPNQCAGGSQCITLQQADIGQVSTGRCLPVCDTSDADADQEDLDLGCPDGDASAFGRFVHLAQGAGEVDIYIDGTLVIDNRGEAAGTTGTISQTFIELPIGQATVDVVAFDATDNSAPLASMEVFTKLNDQSTFVIINGETDLEILDVSVPRNVAAPATGEGKFRVAHDATAAQNVDVYITDDAVAVLPTDTPFATDLARGEVTPFTADMAAGDYDITLFDAGDVPVTNPPLTTLDLTVAADTITTVHAWGDTVVSAALVEYTEAAVTSTSGFCLDQGTEIGLCFERCTGSDGYAQGQCSTDADTCTPFRGADVCWATEGGQIGDACTPGLGACDDGAFCRAYGDGTGICANYCQPFGETNPALGCPSGQACQAISDEERNLGQCGFECSPTDFPSDPSDPTCPDNLKNCLPYEVDDTGASVLPTFCSPSGSVALDADCESVGVQNCAPGALCRRDADIVSCSEIPQEGTLTSTLYGPLGAFGETDGGQCRQVCELFADDCPDGQGCMIDSLEASAQVGFCMPAADELADVGIFESCPFELNGMMCGDGSVCTTFQGGVSLCLQFCDRTDGSICGDDFVCQPFFSDQDQLGYCVEPE